MNCAQALSIAIAALVVAGEPIRAPLAHAQAILVASAAEGQAMSRAAIGQAAALFESRNALPERGFAYVRVMREEACASGAEANAHAEFTTPRRLNSARRNARLHFKIPDASIHATPRSPV
ncbi:MAG: hypothetical protein H7124_14305 [Phycisphaerales bacterium]|nr:hypothetical protein [Hyphomonadaceae bacterium]